MLKQLSTLFLDLLFPRLCVHCKREFDSEGALCQSCLRLVPLHHGPSQTKPFILYGASSYQNPVLKTLVLELKFKRNRETLLNISTLLSQYIKNLKLERYDFLLPVPVSSKTMKVRSFNQAQLIADMIRPFLPSATYSKNLLLRLKHRPSQSAMKSFEGRWENIEGSFALSEPALFKDKAILLVDDVYTSGATIQELRKLLKGSGARRIDAFVLARA
ncbi:MAG: double zinc ribbon domain-containing protein [Candidatus Harrisonbacteria bacterium]|nr:double zinc ribbon domain-containing protein [Candidatus Harrisonbacteria bacterium]